MRVASMGSNVTIGRRDHGQDRYLHGCRH
jgi:hypothetical protein